VELRVCYPYILASRSFSDNSLSSQLLPLVICAIYHTANATMKTTDCELGDCFDCLCACKLKLMPESGKFSISGHLVCCQKVSLLLRVISKD